MYVPICVCSCVCAHVRACVGSTWACDGSVYSVHGDWSSDDGLAFLLSASWALEIF